MGTALARCVGDAGRFLGEHWTRSPLHRRSSNGKGFADLLSLDDVDHLVSTFPRQPTFRLVRDGRPLDPATYTRTARLGGRAVSGVGDAARIHEELHAGATLVLQGLHRYWPAVMRFCRDLEHELTHPAQANAYVTPPSSRGLGVHHDTHDVFVLQLAGRKQWAVHEPVVELPLPSQRWSSDLGDPGPPVLSAELHPGDCLYIPRGFPHSAESRQEVSAHLTVGILTSTWKDVMSDAVAEVVDDLEFRRSLPVGFAHDEDALADDVAEHVERLRAALDKVDARTVARRTVRRFWSRRWPILTGQLGQLMALGQVDDSSSVRRREGSVCLVHLGAGGLSCLLGDRELVMPAELEPVMRWIADRNGFAVSELAEHLDEGSRLTLVRRLVREGLLEIVDVEGKR
ncbi:MAG: cupin domain-containing protein [Actinomycetota bacterium]|nr:cupin domain-containing protein [Actinomycetota bacterium]